MTASTPTFFIVGDERKGPVREAIGQLLPDLEKRCRVSGVDLRGDADLESVEADFLLLFGGDGSILSAARRMGRNQIPTLGVNMGRLGFLAELPRNGWRRAVDALLEGRFEVEERMMIRVRLERDGETLLESLGLNDLVLERYTTSQIVHVTVQIGQWDRTTFSGDGLIVATPVGSTAYCLGAGGPILMPELEAMAVVPICPHALSHRPIVVSADAVLSCRFERPFGEATLSIDGQVSQSLTSEDVVEVARAGVNFRLVKLERGNFFEVLSAKLNWSGRPNYEESEG
ncbi:MAG: NAD(+)/NADH kinase [Planctomycetota bacterium]